MQLIKADDAAAAGESPIPACTYTSPTHPKQARDRSRVHTMARLLGSSSSSLSLLFALLLGSMSGAATAQPALRGNYSAAIGIPHRQLPPGQVRGPPAWINGVGDSLGIRRCSYV